MLDPVSLVALGSAVAACGGGALLVADRRGRAHHQRVTGVVRAYRPHRVLAPVVRRPGEGTLAPSNLLSYLAIRSDRPDLYPAPWWAILLVTTIISVIAEAVGAFLIGTEAWVALPLTWVLLARSVFKQFENRRTNVLYQQLPDALSMIVRSVRVGITVQDSLRVVGEECQWPTSVEFQRLVDEVRVGASLTDGLTRLAFRSGLIEYRFFAVALALQSQSGGSLSETLENLADVVRKRVALRARAIALAAEARLTMYVLAGLPFFTTGVLLVIQPDYLVVLVTTSMGKKLLFAGLALLTMGIMSMQVIIKKSVS